MKAEGSGVERRIFQKTNPWWVRVAAHCAIAGTTFLHPALYDCSLGLESDQPEPSDDNLGHATRLRSARSGHGDLSSKSADEYDS